MSKELNEAAEAQYPYITNEDGMTKGSMAFHNRCMDNYRDAYIKGAIDWQEQRDRWIPISEYPKDSPVVQRWHKIYKCIVSVSNRRAYAEDGLDWVTGTLDHMWPEAAFEPLFKLLPTPPKL